MITVQPFLSTRSSMIVLVMKYFHSWMVSPATMKSTFIRKMNKKCLSFVLRELMLIKCFLLDLKMLGSHSCGLCPMLSMTSSILCRHI